MHQAPQLTHLLFTDQKWSQWKCGSQEAIVKGRRQGQKAELCQSGTGFKIGGNRYCRVMNPNLKVLFRFRLLYRGGQERVQQWDSTAICKTQGRLCMVWFWLSVNIFGIFSKLMELWMQKSVIPSGNHLIGNHFIYQYDSDLKHPGSAMKAYPNRKTHNTTPSVMDWLP